MELNFHLQWPRMGNKAKKRNYIGMGHTSVYKKTNKTKQNKPKTQAWHMSSESVHKSDLLSVWIMLHDKIKLLNVASILHSQSSKILGNFFTYIIITTDLFLRNHKLSDQHSVPPTGVVNLLSPIKFLLHNCVLLF